MFKFFGTITSTNRRGIVVLTAIAILLAVWGQQAQGQAETSLTGSFPDTTSKITNDFPNKSSKEQQSAQQTSTENPSPMYQKVAEEWSERYERLVDGFRDESLDQKDVDSFFQELIGALKDLHERLRITLATLSSPQQVNETSTKSPSESTERITDRQHSKRSNLLTKQTEARSEEFRIAEQVFSDLTVLYKLRIQMLEKISPELRSKVTGTGIAGVKAFKDEIDFLMLMFRVRFHSLPQRCLQSVSDNISAPLPALMALVKLAIAFFVVYWWRRWAVKGIPKMRSGILEIKPRRLYHKWLATVLWYLNRVRRPLEWGILLSVFYNIIITSEEHLISSLLWTNIRMILVAWFVVALVDAMSTRGAAGLRSGTARLRLRSFWLIATWVLIAALGLSTIRGLVGKGTIYAWIWILLKLLMLPVLFLLIRWWRMVIFQNLDEVSYKPAYVKRILQHQMGPISFFGAGFGAVYLIMHSLRRRVVKSISAFEGGRFLIANLTRLEAVRVSENEPQRIQGDPIPDEMRNLLFTEKGGLVESVGKDALNRMVELVEKGRKGTAVIVAERGGGKTQLLKRLDDELEGKMVLFDCPPGGIEAFKEAFAKVLDMNISNLTPEDIGIQLQKNQISVLGIDNLHRVSRPSFGGQQDLNQIAALRRDVQNLIQVFWFFGAEWAAWQYISRVRDSQLFLNEVIRIPRWSEEQIRGLIELRSAQAGIDADFSELVLPHQFEDEDFETIEDRNRFGFYKILWNASDGNPMVSLHLWADSLKVAPDGRIRVSLPQLPVTAELENVRITVLLTLRVIAQSGMASRENIIDSLKLPEAEVAGALNMSMDRGWIESVGTHYRLTWKWFRSIMQVLARQNLLVRKTIGG